MNSPDFDADAMRGSAERESTLDAAFASGLRLQASDAVLSSPLGGEVVLLEPDAGVYYSLNEVGAVLWDRLQSPATLDDLCEAVLAEFEVERETCEPDVRGVVADLLRHALVEWVPAGKGA